MDSMGVITENQNFSAVRPKYLKERLESELYFSHHELIIDFNGFTSSVKLAESLQIVESGRHSRKGHRENKSLSLGEK